MKHEPRLDAHFRRQVMTTYYFGSDDVYGTVKAVSLAAAYDKLRAKISDQEIADGSTLFVASAAGGDRIIMGPDRN